MIRLKEKQGKNKFKCYDTSVSPLNFLAFVCQVYYLNSFSINV